MVFVERSGAKNLAELKSLFWGVVFGARDLVAQDLERSNFIN